MALDLDNKWSMFNNLIYISPVPSTEVELRIFYYKHPRRILSSETYSDVVSEIDDAFQMHIVYSVCEIMMGEANTGSKVMENEILKYMQLASKELAKALRWLQIKNRKTKLTVKPFYMG